MGFKKFKFSRSDVGTNFQACIAEFQKKLKERDANHEQLETIFGGHITELEDELRTRLKKHLLRGKKWLGGLRNIKTRFEKDCDRQTVEPKLHCIIKELSKHRSNQQGQEVEVPLHGWNNLNKNFQRHNENKEDLQFLMPHIHEVPPFLV